MREALVAVIGADSPGADTDLIWLSDLRLRARLSRPQSVESVAVSEFELHAAFETTLGEVLLAREASRRHLEPPPRERVELAEEAFTAAVGGAAQLDRILEIEGAGHAEVLVIAERRARVEAFLSQHLDATTEVTDAEVEDAFARGAHPFATADLEAIRPALHAWLRGERVRAEVARWLSVLRQRTPYRVLRAFSHQSLDEPATSSQSPAEN